ncbi:MAG: hypothetical protein KBD76_01055 [Bacteriovorax sp.]|nr:hypothetical protein [Bacteriovorax sp.]
MKVFLSGLVFLFLSQAMASEVSFCLSAFDPSIHWSRKDKTLTWIENGYQLQFDVEIIDVKRRDQISLATLKELGDRIGHVKKIETLRTSGSLLKMVTTRFNTYLFMKDIFYKELGNSMGCYDPIAPFGDNIIREL